MQLSPIVLFVYNRPWHTRKTIAALQANDLARYSELFVFSDFAKSDFDTKYVDEVRTYIQSISGFKQVTIVTRSKNWGLANSIVDGVTQIIEKYGKVIVVEDDLVTSQKFLNYMNDALNYYKNKPSVWHVSGWNYPIEIDRPEGTFLWRVMNCWGWATWADRWTHYEKNTEQLIVSFDKENISSFNLDGSIDFFSQIISNRKNKIDTWAIYWYASIFINNGLCLNPVQSFVSNIGHDGSGVHCSQVKEKYHILNTCENIEFTNMLTEDVGQTKRIKDFHRRSILSRTKKLLWI